MGVVAPTGIGLTIFWDSLIHCKSGIGPITLFDVSNFPLKIGGQVRDFDLRRHIPNSKPQRLARQTQLALVACRMALQHAGLDLESLRAKGLTTIVLGISSGGTDVISDGMEVVITRGPRHVRPFMVGACQPHAIGAALVQCLGIQAALTTVSEACPSGLDAVMTATRIIKEGRADLVIAGGADSPLNSAAFAGFAACGLPSMNSEFPPEEVSRPFDAKRSGVVLSEGAGFVVLERLDSALARGATPYMEIAGGAMVTDTPGTGKMDGLSLSMQTAMDNAGVYPKQIDYVCANAFGSKQGDIAEVEWIKKCLGDRALRIPVSSIRGVLGHALSAAGMSQVIALAMMMQTRTVIPTANLHYPDPQCDLDHVPLQSRPANIQFALANSHGIGGENGTLVVKSLA